VREGEIPRIWVARDDNAIELRRVKLGLAAGRMVQVLEGLAPGDRVITGGSLFTDRAMAGS
jgi:cobalt-zinc-cadmium efflux system membrane fusion protein